MRLKFLTSKAIGKLSAMYTTMDFPILDLPNELIAHIIEFVDSISDLRHIACTCRRIQQLAEPALYRHVLLRGAAKTRRILSALQARPARAATLHILDVPCDPDLRQDIPALAVLMTAAKNIRQLMVESPSCNSGTVAEFEQEDVWGPMMDQLFLPFQRAVSGDELAARPLQRLTKRT